MIKEIRRVVIIGSGNVAWHLGKIIAAKGFDILQVYGRNKLTGMELAQETGSDFTPDISVIRKDADIYIFSVSDGSVGEIAAQLAPAAGIFIHTAGSVSIDVFKGCALQYGVLYPLQTFTRLRDIDFSNIPVFTEAESVTTLGALNDFASRLTNVVQKADSHARMILHLAAVFACNFTNHMYVTAEQLLKQSNIPFDVLMPLIRETADKVASISPVAAQTGPAVRKSLQVMDLHLKMLENNPSLAEVYEILSKSIMAAHERKD